MTIPDSVDRVGGSDRLRGAGASSSEEVDRLGSELDELAAGEFDEVDAALLAAIRAVYAEVDPVPNGLVERIQFELTLDALHAEVATLTQLDLASSGARGDSTESVRTITFTADAVTTIISLTPATDGTVRVDGWAAPGAGLLVEARLTDSRYETRADQDGRFVFDGLPTGLAKFALHTTNRAGGPHTVVTPAIDL